jgi:DNA-binding Lrp family transcriptional regulator
VDRRVLEALAAFADGAAINELAAATGQAAGALRRRLDKLAAAGRVERVAAGLRTRYRRTGG